ncbi:myb/SANT-like domain, Harbinger transposase-derived nuclease domain protein [Artemisia annua]|uniref:Myb/SANT-like domain, Harbinger transposase-derived nuclease domain protein n=1 Tax=Artemisia annua TaxID=35608 RepID=A0A2U1PZ26_ARTAN|nr:myb/SANT-like domain, Harbinger transposase-derived nuclease domain protein [Artemisia annua]
MASKSRNYKGWSSREEAKLVELLVDMVNNGEFVSDNGFKNGYLVHLEQQLKVHFPKSGLTGKPHIESKIRLLKKDWNSVYDMLNGPNASGFCFLGDTNMLDAPESVWDDYLARNPKSTKWKTKEFPHYNDLCKVFGKDRAQGSGAMNIVEIKDDTNADVQASGDDLDGTMEENIDTQSYTNEHVEEPSSVRSGKRKCRADEEPSSFLSRKKKSGVDPMVDVLSEACTTSKIRNYKGWSSREEAKLVELLVDMVNNGEFISDNGFKHGYQLHLEQQLKVHFPKSGLTGKHIESKVKTLKKDWNAVYDMLNGPNTSGFCFLGDTNMLDAPESVWDDYLAHNPKSSKWKTKEFPHYYDLCMVFGKDRAQGNGAMNIVEIKDDTNIDVPDSGDGLDGTMDENIDTRSNTNDHVEEPSSVRSEKRKSRADEEPSSVRSRKEKSRVDPMVDVLSEACNILGDHLYKAATKMSREVELEEAFEKKVDMVISELSKMKSLSRMERFKAIDIITSNPRHVKIFWGLIDEEREAWVRYKLQE